MISLDFNKFKKKVIHYDQGEEGLNRWLLNTMCSSFCEYLEPEDVVGYSSDDLVAVYLNTRDYISMQRGIHPPRYLVSELDKAKRAITRRRLL